MMEKDISWEKCFLHIDMDAFFASVEQHDHPLWKGKPVIVGGLPGERRSVVSTASYEARKFGVHSAMPTSKAFELCPHGIYTHGNMKRYIEISNAIMELLCKYSPDVEQLSIDEACVELTGTQRLFGTPEEVAKKIRREIFENTGLTVSAGIASTRYLAKIASEVKKPNGFYQINPGDETKFMLGQDLKKIWGIGDKTLKKLNSYGFFTTAQIYQQKLETLEGIFGKTTATFLYNSLRGIENLAPGKSDHSISAETTFCFDLTNLYNAQTALLELCTTVMFRLNKEKGASRTCSIKIRYEDFTTFTVQETQNEYITSVDDLFSRTSALLQKKYEEGRGIRLLGVCISNIESKDTPRQKNLIDFGEKKRQAVENSIMNLSQKFPELKIKKARLLEKIKDNGKQLCHILIPAVMFALSYLPLHGQNDYRKDGFAGSLFPSTGSELLELPSKAEGTVLSVKNIDFYANGWWQAELSAPFSFSFNPSKKNSDDLGFSFGMPVFKQKIDLDASLWINKQWYFQTSFADEFEKNTIAAGFIGQEKDFIRHIRVANRGIVFPNDYSINDFGLGIGGGDNQAPGISASFLDVVNGKWKADAVIRYDTVKQHDATFYGKNSVIQNNTKLSAFLRGQIFFLPSKTLIQNLSAIYVENKNGEYMDKNKRKYKKLPQSQYLILQQKQIVLLSVDAQTYSSNSNVPHVIFEFQSISSKSQLESLIGRYEDSSTYLGKIQNYFGSKLETRTNSSKPSQFAYDIYTQMDTKQSLIVQSPSGFSPFIASYRYDAGNISAADVYIADPATDKSSQYYAAQIANDSIDFAAKDFINSKHLFVDVFCEERESHMIMDEQDMFPFADRFPEVYLSSDQKTNLHVILKNYSPVSRYDIGTNASGGSVRLYRNGILDTGATYNSQSGEVVPSHQVSDFDKIYITWNEDGSDFSQGAVSAALGFEYSFSPKIKTDLAFSTNWSASSQKKYAEENRAQGGFAALSSSFNYISQKVSFSNSTAVSLQNPNTTGLYRILSMDDFSSKTFYHNKNDGYYIGSSTVPRLNNQTSQPYEDLDLEYNRTQTSSGCEGKNIAGITGYAIPLSWKFQTESSKKQWAAMNVKLSDGNSLSNSTQFSFALKAEDYDSSDYDVFLQLGIDCKEENPEDFLSIPTWKITDQTSPQIQKPFHTDGTLSNDSGWQTVTIRISDWQRSKIASSHDMRIICVSKSDPSKALENTLFIGPYETNPIGMSISHNDIVQVTSCQSKDNSVPKKSIFNESDNFSQKISWNFTSIPETEQTVIKAQKFFSQVDFSSYEKLILYFKITDSSSTILDLTDPTFDENDCALCILLDSESSSIDSQGKIALKAEISRKDMGSIFASSNNNWHKIEINIQKKKFHLDDREIEPLSFTINKKIVFNRLFLSFSPAFHTDNGFQILQEQSIVIDELHLKDLDPYYLLQNRSAFQAQNQELDMKIAGFSLLQHPSFEARLLASKTLSQNKKSNIDSQNLEIQMESFVTLIGMDLDFSADFSSAEKGGIQSISHKIQTHSPLFGFLSLSDSFLYSHSDYSSDKQSAVSASFGKNAFPFSISAKSQLQKNRSSINQREAGTISMGNGQAVFLPHLEFTLEASQKQKPKSSYSSDFDSSTYFDCLKQNYKDFISLGDPGAYHRKVSQNASISQKIAFADGRINGKWNLSSTYSTTKNVMHTSVQYVELSFPFKIGKSSFDIKYSKTGSETTSCIEGGSYKDDFEKLYSAIGENSYFYEVFPFQDLLDPHFDKTVLKNTSKFESLESLFYSSNYSFSWKRNLFGSISDFFMPMQFSFETERDIRTNVENTDLYQFKATSSNLSINLFGKQGTNRLFEWFDTDEYSFSLSTSAKVPSDNPSDCLFTFSAYLQGTIFMKEKDSLKSASQFKISTDQNWTFTQIASWNRKTHFNPLLSFIKLFSNENFSSKLDCIDNASTDTLSISLANTSSDYYRNYQWNHKIEGNLNSFISVNAGFDLILTCSQIKSDTITMNLSIGSKLQF